MILELVVAGRGGAMWGWWREHVSRAGNRCASTRDGTGTHKGERRGEDCIKPNGTLGSEILGRGEGRDRTTLERFRAT